EIQVRVTPRQEKPQTFTETRELRFVPPPPVLELFGPDGKAVRGDLVTAEETIRLDARTRPAADATRPPPVRLWWALHGGKPVRGGERAGPGKGPLDWKLQEGPNEATVEAVNEGADEGDAALRAREPDPRRFVIYSHKKPPPLRVSLLPLELADGT